MPTKTYLTSHHPQETHCSWTSYGGFHKWCYPQIDVFFGGKSQEKMDDWSQVSGNPHIKKRKNPAIVEHHPNKSQQSDFWSALPMSAWIYATRRQQHIGVLTLIFRLSSHGSGLGARQPWRLWAAPAVGPKSLCDTLRFDVDCWPIGSSSSSSSPSSSSWLRLSWWYQYIYIYI